MTPRSPALNLLPEEKTKVLVAVKAASAKKAERMRLFDLVAKASFTDYILICSGTSDRHVQAIARGIEEDLRKLKIKPLGIEGEDVGQWVLLDFNGLIVHVFQETSRDFYDLEGLWSDCPLLDVEKILAEAEKAPEKPKVRKTARPAAAPDVAASRPEPALRPRAKRAATSKAETLDSPRIKKEKTAPKAAPRAAAKKTSSTRKAAPKGDPSDE